jgi:hypothetical protein
MDACPATGTWHFDLLASHLLRQLQMVADTSDVEIWQ